MKTLLFLALMAANGAQGKANNFQTIPNKSLHVEDKIISFENHERHSVAFSKRSGGGDDVGNGGDEIRLRFMAISNGIIEKLLSTPQFQNLANQLKSVISAKNILVVEKLEINNAETAVAITDDVIILDRKSWNTIDGLLTDTMDPRLEILRIISERASVSLSEKDLITLYGHMPFFTSFDSGERVHATPWCPLRPERTKIEKTPETFSLSQEKDPEGLKALALKSCSDKGLKECKVAEIKYGGFAGFKSSYKATVQGFHYKTIELSSKEQKLAHCMELQRCSQIFELAPQGQISPENYKNLDEQITASCL